jgi:hypothetical protein
MRERLNDSSKTAKEIAQDENLQHNCILVRK